MELSVFPVEAAAIRGWLGGRRVEPEVVPPPAPHAVALLAGLAEVAVDDFLVVDTMNVMLVAVNAAYVGATGCDGERVALRDIASGR